jgi:hypothetical protein
MQLERDMSSCLVNSYRYNRAMREISLSKRKKFAILRIVREYVDAE